MKRNRYIALLTLVVLAFGSLAAAQQEHGQTWCESSNCMAALEHPKTGELVIGESAVVGTTTLQPGIYEVRHVTSANGHYVQFARRSDQPSDGGETGQGFYSWTVVAKAPCTMTALSARANQTSVQTSRTATIAYVTGLTIRGEGVVHGF